MKPCHELASVLIAAGVVAVLSCWDHCPADVVAPTVSQEDCCEEKSVHCEITDWAWVRWASSAALNADWVCERRVPISAWPSSPNQPGDHHAAVGCLLVSSARSGARLEAGTPSPWSRSHWARSCAAASLKLFWRSPAACAVTAPPAARHATRRSGGIR
jgi:hypothetical protein